MTEVLTNELDNNESDINKKSDINNESSITSEESKELFEYFGKIDPLDIKSLNIKIDELINLHQDSNKDLKILKENLFKLSKQKQEAFLIESKNINNKYFYYF